MNLISNNIASAPQQLNAFQPDWSAITISAKTWDTATVNVQVSIDNGASYIPLSTNGAVPITGIKANSIFFVPSLRNCLIQAVISTPGAVSGLNVQFA